MAGRPVVVTRVVNSMTNNLRPNCAKATDVANRFCHYFMVKLNQAEKVYNQDLYFKKTVKYVGEPESHGINSTLFTFQRDYILIDSTTLFIQI